MEKACTNLTEVVRFVRLFKIDGFSMTMCIGMDYSFKSRWSVDGYDWEVRIYPRTDEELNRSWVSIRLIHGPIRESEKNHWSKSQPCSKPYYMSE